MTVQGRAGGSGRLQAKSSKAMEILKQAQARALKITKDQTVLSASRKDGFAANFTTFFFFLRGGGVSSHGIQRGDVPRPRRALFQGTLAPPCPSPPQGRRPPTNPWGTVTK